MKSLEVIFNKEKSLVEAFSMHCETSRRFIDSSNGSTETLEHAHPQQLEHRIVIVHGLNDSG